MDPASRLRQRAPLARLRLPVLRRRIRRQCLHTHNDNPPETQLWLDWGRDFYAAQSYSDVPASDGRRIIIGWISNWMYARDTPTSPWRGGQSVPREVKLQRFKQGLRLTQQPVREIEKLRGTSIDLDNVSIAEANRAIQDARFSGDVLEIEAELEIGDAQDIGFRLLAGDEEETLVGYTASPSEIYVDRTNSGQVDFHETFAGRHSARLQPVNGRVKVRILVDRSVVEVFGGDGQAAITDRVFPDPGSQAISLYSKGDDARLNALRIWTLQSAW